MCGNFNLYQLNLSYQIWVWFIFLYQKSLKRTFQTGFWVQNHLLNLCSSVVNSQRLLCSQKASVKSPNFYLIVVFLSQNEYLLKEYNLIIFIAIYFKTPCIHNVHNINNEFICKFFYVEAVGKTFVKILFWCKFYCTQF